MRIRILVTAAALLATASLAQAQPYECEQDTICETGGCSNNVCLQRCTNLDSFCDAPCGCEGQPAVQACFQGVCRCCVGGTSCPSRVCDLGPRENVCPPTRVMAPVNAFPCGTPPNETCCRVGWICRGGVCSPPDVDGGIGRIVALRGGDNVIVNGDVYKLGAILHHGDSIFLGSSGATTATIFVTLESGGPFTLILHAGGQVKLPPAPPSPVERIFQLPQGLMRGIDRGLPAQNQFEVEALNSVLGVEGTDFTIEADPDRLLDTVVVYEGAVLVTPKNPALAPVRLEAGQQIAVSPDTIGPALPCLPEECNDGEPCSADACTPAGCQNVPVTGFEAACSACQGGLGSPSCAGESVPPGIGKRIALACSLREQAATNPDGAKKLLRRAKGALKSGRAKARKAANRQTNPLDAACASAITGALRPPF